MIENTMIENTMIPVSSRDLNGHSAVLRRFVAYCTSSGLKPTHGFHSAIIVMNIFCCWPGRDGTGVVMEISTQSYI